VKVCRFLVLSLGVLLVGLAPDAARAQSAASPSTPIRVALYVNPPFVIKTESGFGGFAVELWEHAASKGARRFEYKPVATLSELLRVVSTGETDIAVTNLTVTHGRFQHMDFTQPWFESGLRLMVNERRHASGWLLLRQLKDSGHLRVYLWISVVILAATIILTVVDRIFDPEFPREWSKGIAESFYQVMSIATSGKAPHKNLFGTFGRVLSALWMVAGVAVVAYIISSVTSVMTASSLTSHVTSTADLPGKTVGVVRSSVAEAFAIDAALSLRAFDNLDAAVDALVKNRISAVIDDAPDLEYYDHTHPDLPITVVGAIFRPQKYGFAVPVGSPLAREVSRQILAARESGLLRRLRSKYFGNTP
jgi:ABC-type amino acid transport substrate-binding protein